MEPKRPSPSTTASAALADAGDEGTAGHTVTALLARWSAGERTAAEELMPRVYDELRALAHRYFARERPDHTLQATAVVHEVYLTLVEQRGLRWRNRAHFFGLAACMMRRALIDHARSRAFLKRGGGAHKVSLTEARALERARPADLIALDDALRDLARVDPLKALIVELRFFGGLTVDQTAACLGISPRSVARQWRRAKAVLYGQLDAETRDAL